jgi:hypothetical protein
MAPPELRDREKARARLTTPTAHAALSKRLPKAMAALAEAERRKRWTAHMSAEKLLRPRRVGRRGKPGHGLVSAGGVKVGGRGGRGGARHLQSVVGSWERETKACCVCCCCVLLLCARTRSVSCLLP